MTSTALARRLNGGRTFSGLFRSFSSLGTSTSNTTSTASSLLSYDVIGDENATRTWIFTHGLLGSGRNWTTFAKTFAKEAEGIVSEPLRVLLVDLRCHGKSTQKSGLKPPHNLQAAAGDFVRLVKKETSRNRLDGFVGHSLGGKVLMQYLLSIREHEHKDEQDVESELLPRQAWVLDSVPSVIDDAESKVILADTELVLSIIHTIPLCDFERQSEVQTFLESKGIAKGVAMWLCSNLKKDRGKEGKKTSLSWKFDFKGAKEMFHSFKCTSTMDVLEDPPHGVDIHLVRGAKSFRLKNLNLDKYQRHERGNSNSGNNHNNVSSTSTGSITVHTLPKAGHWVHVDNPKGLLTMMLSNLHT